MSTPAPIAVQLYSVRELLGDDFAGVVKKIADKGYVGVEPFGLDVEKAKMQAQVFADLGLQVSSMHGPLPLGDDKNMVLDCMGIVGSKRVYPSASPATFATVDSIKELCDRLNEGSAIAAESGLTVGYHNHDWEFQPVEDTGKTGYAIMLELLEPAVEMQIDTYWVKVGGHDPAALVSELGKRSPTLHIKDGSGDRTEPQTAVGAGIMDVPAIVQAAADSAEWLIVELDHCGTDILAAVLESYDYLVGEGLARGR
ncbi:sugar phosphate isomerase/epimerase family protein [Chloroflexota bacterium]